MLRSTDTPVRYKRLCSSCKPRSDESCGERVADRFLRPWDTPLASREADARNRGEFGKESFEREHKR